MQVIKVLFQAIRFGMILRAKLLGPANFRGVWALFSLDMATSIKT